MSRVINLASGSGRDFVVRLDEEGRLVVTATDGAGPLPSEDKEFVRLFSDVLYERLHTQQGHSREPDGHTADV